MCEQNSNSCDHRCAWGLQAKCGPAKKPDSTVQYTRAADQCNVC